MDGLDVTSAAYELGYESVSQFNREYSRMFGQPPMRDIKALRNSFKGCDRECCVDVPRDLWNGFAMARI